MADDSHVDDDSILDEWTLWRRIPLRPSHVVPDGQGGFRPSSAAFQNDPDGGPMSVVIAELGGDVQRALQGHDDFGLVALSVGAVRQLGQKVVRDPVEGEPAHGLVVGDKPKRGFCRRIAKSATWVVGPDEGSDR